MLDFDFLEGEGWSDQESLGESQFTLLNTEQPDCLERGLEPGQDEWSAPLEAADRWVNSKRKLQSPVMPSLRAAIISAIQSDASERYAITQQDDGYQASSHKQQLHAAFTPKGVHLTPQEGTYSIWRWGMEFVGYGYGEPDQPLPLPNLVAEGNRMEYRRGMLTEWYLNGPLGIEQGFTLLECPSIRDEDKPLTLTLDFTGDFILSQMDHGKGIHLTPAQAEAPLRYGDLYATDATGRSLPVQIELGARTGQHQPVNIQVDDRDAVYPLTIDPLIQQETKLTASDGANNDMFGDSIAFSGNTVVVGAYQADLPSKADAGAAYVFVRSGSTWSQQAKLTASDSAAGAFFGNGVDIYGDTIVVGADLTDLAGGKTNAGAAYVFVRSGSTWSQQAKLTASDSAASDFLGANVGIYQDTVVASATSADLPGKSDAGAVYVFTRSGSTWSQQAKLTASDAAHAAFFGGSATIYGDTAVMGGPNSVYVFVRNGTTWSQQAKLAGNDTVSGDAFGGSVRIYGDTMVVGARSADLPGMTNAGAVYVFERIGTVWTQQAKLTADDAAASDLFGWAVATDGNTIVVGAIGADPSGVLSAGAGYVFVRSGSTWSQQAKLTANDGVTSDQLGYFVDVSGGTFVLGAPNDPAGTSHGAVYVFTNPVASTNTGPDDGPLAWSGEVYYDNSLNIRTGEKIESFRDISVNTPVGPMEFIRTYRQNKRSTFQFMGLGWTHNHAATLTKIMGTPNTIVVQLPGGGELHLTETSTNHYDSDAGADSAVDYDPVSTNYTLTATDTSTMVFDSTGKLISRSWPGGETWSYTYTSGKLTLVDDGNGHQLQFSYISNPGQFNDGMLRRVGNQDSTGLGGGSPTDPYVEFTYVTQKNNGVTIGSPKALLNTVRDTLGNVWTYKSYGQIGGQSDANQLDFMIEVVSPSIDTNGDGGAGAVISLEQLTYTVTGATINSINRLQGDSLLNTDFAFQPNLENTTTETPHDANTEITTHRFANGTYAGFDDPEGNSISQAMNFQYRPEQIQDGNGNTTQMMWTTKGHRVVTQKDALGNTTTFAYLSSPPASKDALDFRLDPDGRKTKFTYGDANNPRRPTTVQIYDADGATILHWEQFTYDTHGRVLTEKLFDPTGTILQKETDRAYYTSGNGKGHLQTLTQVDLVNPANNIVTTYFYDKSGRVVKTSQNSNFGVCQISYTVYDHTGRVVATICNYVNGGADPTTAAQAVALYDPALPDQNRVTTYTYDKMGRRTQVTTDAGASYAVTNVTVYDSLSRVKRTIQNYVASSSITDPYVHNRDDFNHGINNDQNLITDLVCNKRGKLRKQIDVLGNVTLYGYDKALRLVRTVQNASQPTYNNDYTTGGDTLLAWYRQRVGLDTPDQDLVTSMEYDKANNPIRSTDPLGSVTLSAYDKLNRPVKVIRNASRPTYNLVRDPSLQYYDPVSSADQDLVTITEYDSMGRVNRQQDELGNWTLFVYDFMGKPVKTIRNASRPDYNRTADPTFQYYIPSTSVDLDLITEMAYDPADRQMVATDELGRRDWTAYDGLGRLSKTINNAVGKASDGTVDDPRSAGYHANDNLFDQDQVLLVSYDASGRVWRTRDNLGNWTLYGYDTLKRQVKVVRNASNFAYDTTNDAPLSHYVPAVGAADDQDLIAQTIYDGQGRVAATIDPLGIQTSYKYDALGRRLQTIQNVVTGTFNPTYLDQDMVSTTSYDVAGRVTATVDGRGKQTTFVYDRAGRQKLITDAAGTAQAINTYRCYDKGGWLLRLIQNWINDPTQTNPDARDSLGNWLFNPVSHGTANDQNLITTFTYDKVGRVLSVSNPVGNASSTTYDKVGQMLSSTDPLNVVTQYRYDKARRRVLTVQSYQSNGEDPSLWMWNGSAWTKSDGTTAIAFGAANDQNLIMLVDYDKAGRQVALRDPRGNRTTYAYDQLDRRTQLTNPLNQSWVTSYLNLPTGGSRMTLTDPKGNLTQHDFDRLGREISVQYLNESPKNTPDVLFAYNKSGNRLSMTEINAGATVRKTAFSYDDLQRLAQVGFDENGDGSFDETVSYGYDAGGLRTRLTLPGGLNINYGYDILGQLTSLTDWDSQATQYSYDGAQRLTSALRANNLLSSYQYDPAGRVTLVRHTANNQTLGHFAYTVDARGNRTQLYQGVPRSTTGSTTLVYNDPTIDYYQGTWTDANPYKTSASTNANLRLAFLASQVTLTMGKGPDHGIYGIYVDGVLQQTVDGYSASTGDQATTLTLTDEGPHTLEVRNTGTKNASSTGFKVRYKTLATSVSARLYDLLTYTFAYDAMTRIKTVSLYPGINTNAAATEVFTYSYDVAHNRTQKTDTLGSTVNYTYNAANQISSAGFTYDNNGNLTADGTNTYTWDRANRLLSKGSVSYLYNGLGQRLRQTVSGVNTDYLLDLGLGLWEALTATTSGATTRYVHGPRGLLGQKDDAGVWTWPVEDGLGSVLAVVNNSVTPLESRQYDPYGIPTQKSGSSQTVFNFTGEMRDASDSLIYLRNRYFDPALGQFLSLDPAETFNRYAYVNGNPINLTDPSGLISRLMYDDNEGYAVAQRNSKQITKSTMTPTSPPIVPPPPPLTPPPAVSSESQSVQGAYNNVVNKGLKRLTQNCSDPIFRAANPETCSVQSRLFGRDQFQLRYDSEWGLSLDPRQRPMKAISNGRINNRILARNMSAVFGYNIIFGDITGKTFNASSDTAKQLTLNLLDSNLQATAYFQEKGGAQSALANFRGNLARTYDDRTVSVYLGADDTTGGSFQGYTPRSNTTNHDKIFLGSNMDTAGITHEFGHQFDRHYQHDISNGGFISYAPGMLNPEQAIQYRADCLLDAGEFIPDYFMTAVLNDQSYTGGKPFNCPGSVPTVGFQNTNFGRNAQSAFDNYVTGILNGSIVP
jgi:RHS repeat-associated protein